MDQKIHFKQMQYYALVCPVVRAGEGPALAEGDIFMQIASSES